MPEKQKKWALITGASPGGIGEAEVAAFLKRGVNVIATSIDIEENAHDIDDLKKQLNDNRDRLEGFLVSLRLDVTSTESIEAALEKVKELTGGRLDYLVNSKSQQPKGPSMKIRANPLLIAQTPASATTTPSSTYPSRSQRSNSTSTSGVSSKQHKPSFPFSVPQKAQS